jgi:tRNA/tmRNA/rRNA uracil-C5-methylase (TrmA/RlmC/RlmD family)
LNSKKILKIEKLVPTGYGLSRENGFVHFVPFVLPGETVEASVIEQKKNFAFAKVDQLHETSKSRIKPRCEVFGQCGGCDWQHIPYPEQLQFKQSFLTENLAKFLNADSCVEPIISSNSEFNYRNRVVIKKRNGLIGYYKRGSHDLVTIKTCPIAEEAVNLRMNELDSKPDGDYLVSAEGVFNIDQQDIPEFFQVNSSLNQRLIDYVIGLFDKMNSKPKTVFDFYCGSGNFTFPILESIKNVSVIGVELSSASVARAQKVAIEKGLSPKKIRFLNGKCEAVIKNLQINESDAILLDPPRGGCEKEFLHHLAISGCKKIIYISCNLSTLTRDLDFLKSLGLAFKINSLQGFDMFPQTSHIETVAEIQVDFNPRQS